jgi:hypothetical protein
MLGWIRKLVPGASDHGNDETGTKGNPLSHPSSGFGRRKESKDFLANDLRR